MTEDGGSLACATGHSFDIARQGYAGLVTGAGSRISDTAAMVGARDEFLTAGHYAPIADAVVNVLREAPQPDGVRRKPVDCPPDAHRGSFVIDLAGGTGYYAARVMEAIPGGHGLVVDLSKYALRRAARVHGRVAAVAADVWNSVPVRDGAASAVLSIFGPRNPAEIARVLAPDGVLVVVTPTDRHLSELRSSLGLMAVDSRKAERLAAQLAIFEAGSAREIEYRVELSHADVFTAAMMGPNAFHRDPGEVRTRVAELPAPFPVTVSVSVRTFRRAE
ncbi:methyltransferase domain-containing protein [Spelaeicoccus albus]